MSGSGYIDLRSDTVTRPTRAMRRAMADAEVGDDLFGDDPTVIAGILPAHIDLDAVQTNIVFVDVAGTGQPLAAWQASLAAEGVLVTIVAGKIRMLTHAGVTARDIDAALDAWRRVTAALGVPSPASAR